MNDTTQMVRKSYIKTALVFIVFVEVSSFMVGCASKPETETGWVSVTKPPIRVIYINRHGAVPASMVHGIIKQVEAFPYHDYHFNESTGVLLESTSHQSSSTSNSSSVDISR